MRRETDLFEHAQCWVFWTDNVKLGEHFFL